MRSPRCEEPQVSSADRSTRAARRVGCGQKHRSHDPWLSAEAIRVYDSWATGDHRPSRRRSEGIWPEVFRFHRLVALAIGLPREASRPSQEVARHGRLDAGSFLRQRNRTDAHPAGCRSASSTSRASEKMNTNSLKTCSERLAGGATMM